jgi:Na+-transporting NADH:ubiquinone oxidoreductase subunit NqrD
MIVIPAAAIMIIGLMIWRWRTWGRASLGHEEGGCPKHKSKR